jgi:hypothetical protein
MEVKLEAFWSAVWVANVFENRVLIDASAVAPADSRTAITMEAAAKARVGLRFDIGMG